MLLEIILILIAVAYIFTNGFLVGYTIAERERLNWYKWIILILFGGVLLFGNLIVIQFQETSFGFWIDYHILRRYDNMDKQTLHFINRYNTYEGKNKKKLDKINKNNNYTRKTSYDPDNWDALDEDVKQDI